MEGLGAILLAVAGACANHTRAMSAIAFRHNAAAPFLSAT